MSPVGAGRLADIVPSLLAVLGVPDTANTLGFPDGSRVCLLLVDGLGWRLLRQHEAQAPFLSSLVAGGEPVSVGFPATTATSVAALGTGMPAGEHGVVGYTFAVDGELLNALGWRRHGTDQPVDLRSTVPPERVQPRPTAFERASAAGVAVAAVVPREQQGSGLSRAVLRGGRFLGVRALGDLTSNIHAALRDGDRTLCYAYHGDLDLLGHVYGPGSDPWCQQLRYVDHLAATIADGLPPDGVLVVTGDHGMVEVSDHVDFDAEPALADGVRLLGGEPRARHVYVEPGAADDVLATWTERLGDRAQLATREEAVAAGWFGRHVADRVLPRIGDIVVAASGGLAVVRNSVEPRMSRLVGHHGSFTADEQLVPVAVSTG